jgi:hypothetical protein
MGKAFSHELRVMIMGELNQREMSATMFMRKFPQYSHSMIWGHFLKLEKYGFAERVGRKSGGKRRGGSEVFFRANARALFDQTSWALIPDSIKETVTGATASAYVERIKQAIDAGTIDIRPDRHFTWVDGQYDQQAWDETIEEQEAMFARLPQRQAEASVRLAESGEEPIRVTVALACFESPKASPEDD